MIEYKAVAMDLDDTLLTKATAPSQVFFPEPYIQEVSCLSIREESFPRSYYRNNQNPHSKQLPLPIRFYLLLQPQQHS